ncbi:hypothetical protein CCACVL1_28359 [Corchorus capsularis]|uniref:KIB1-4 beta-propeller domain-containing protein n=1 Tax=Corchorus capsularis TaxID=210143 RepID=A0A1R3G6R9_COCAP|nr:hypothetical protein CCACVL1_28359 [Corchorus capsularis]
MTSPLPQDVSSDWADIPSDILRYIAGKILSIQDSIRITSVCRSWRSSLQDYKTKFPIYLMLAEDEQDKNNNMRCFCTASEDNAMEFELSAIKGKRCWGGPFVWLATYSNLDHEIQLFNPLTRACFSLPSQQNFGTGHSKSSEVLGIDFIHKLYLSSSPSLSDCVVMAIYADRSCLAFAKPGDQSWTPIDFTSSIWDVTCFNGTFFAVNSLGQLLKCEGILDGITCPKAVQFAEPPPQLYSAARKYIVDLDGYLCMIARIVGDYEYLDENGKVEIETVFLTEEFQIVKLDMETKEWERIVSLGDRSVFLGNCCTFSVLASDYNGCTPNSIHFTHDEPSVYFYSGGMDTGIYNCETKQFLRLPDRLDDEHEHGFRSKLSPPLWINLSI